MPIPDQILEPTSPLPEGGGWGVGSHSLPPDSPRPTPDSRPHPDSRLPLPFNPPPEAADTILDDLADPDTTLRAVAHRAGASLESFTIWLNRPDIAERVANIESAVTRRTRLIATNYLPSAVKTVARILDEYNEEESHAPVRDVAAREQRRRARETARRAASLLLRLARFEPVSSPATDQRSPRSRSVPHTPGGMSLRPVSPAVDLCCLQRSAAPTRDAATSTTDSTPTHPDPNSGTPGPSSAIPGSKSEISDPESPPPAILQPRCLDASSLDASLPTTPSAPVPPLSSEIPHLESEHSVAARPARARDAPR